MQRKRRPVNYEIFFFLTNLFAIDKKYRKSLRKQFVCGKIDQKTFDQKRIAWTNAFDARYQQIYRVFA